MLERRPAARDTPDPEFAARALALREALGLRAFDFVMVMEEHGYRLSQSELSRIEHAQRGVTRAIIDAYARIDPARRGRLWWGWGLDADDLRSTRTSREITPDDGGVLLRPVRGKRIHKR